jgi:AcrR family transcriptional regulator
MAKPAKLRDRILKVAGEKFLSQGFYKVSMDSLVAELRASKSSIYKHFASKEILVRTLVEQVNAIVDEQLRQIVENESLGFTDKLTRLMRFHSRARKIFGPAFLDDLRIHTPDLWEAHHGMEQARVRAYHLRLFQQGVREGILREDIDLSLLVVAFLRLCELAVAPAKEWSPPYGNEVLIEQLTLLFLEGAMREA